jgi:hypothetical protein
MIYINEDDNYKEMSVCGFPVEHLITGWKLLKSRDITIDDIKIMTSDIKYVMKLMREQQQKSFEKSVEHMTNQFKK